jgi:hypothetical protein
MEVVTLLLYVGAVWVIAAIGFFMWNVLARAHEHADRLAVLPLEDNWSDPRIGTPRSTEAGKHKP